jgi:choline dehydrogenase-like flavoprotein
VSGRVTVIGSGASGVHFALTLLRRGRQVMMIDVGREGQPVVHPAASYSTLKEQLEDPAAYFLGSRFEAVLWPGGDKEYYGIPPSKEFVFDAPDEFTYRSSGFAPLFSFARGGLGEVWTGGCYPLNAGEILDFPFSHADLLPHYDEVARRIGVTGEADDLERFMPMHRHLQPPLRLDRHSEVLMSSYGRARARLNRAGVYVGRTRVATISQPLGSREPCSYQGRCLWGCPRGALYTPSQTLQECRAYAGFTYVPGVQVSHLNVGVGGRISAVVGRDVATGAAREFAVETVALAAGALLSTRIYLTSIARHTGRHVRLGGLMDNRQVLVPFVNISMVGKPFSPDTYQYHLLGMGLDSGTPRDYVHGQITTLKTALVHPLIQRLPVNLRAAIRLFRGVHAALGLVNVNLRDSRRDANFVELDSQDSDRLRIHYESDSDEPTRIAEAMKKVKSALRALNCIVPPGMAHVRPMGASVHYAGTLPMTKDPRPNTTDAWGRSHDFQNLVMADGATFPFLPAKNITFTLMANAVRIAEALP